MQLVAFILNLPWSVLFLGPALLSVPTRVEFHSKPWACVIEARSFWWYGWTKRMRGVRAMTLGNIILLGPRLLDKDLEHELVHIKQHQREPFIHPILSAIETLRHGYRQNKYEEEAYTKTNSKFIGHKL